jgi:flagellar basal-body rod protein FlgF
MDNAFLVGLSAQQVLQKRMDTTANNLANMTTAGFKAERLVMRELSEKPAQAADKPQEIDFVDAWTLQRDFSTGNLDRTGNPLDVAIEGDGFFSIQTPQGPAYTRDGRFTMNAQGQLITKAGMPVLGPIQVNPNGGEVAITKDGKVMQDNETVGTLNVVRFPHPGALEKMGDNLWKQTDEAPQPLTDVRIAQGFVESSNVNAVSEITQMIDISRTYESISRMIDQADQLRGTSIDKLTRVT